MERDGLVERRKTEGDSRVVQVWLTVKAHQLITRLTPAAQQYVGRLTAGVEADEVQSAMHVLSRILTSLE